MKKMMSVVLVGTFIVLLALPSIAMAGIEKSITPTGYDDHRYQSIVVPIRDPGKQNVPESDLTVLQMSNLMGSNYSENAGNATKEDIIDQLKTYWLPNSLKQLSNTFQSFENIKSDVGIYFGRSLTNSFSNDCWAITNYYGYGNSGADNHMLTISIILDMDNCLDAGANSRISGSDDGYYAFDQIVAHELMHAFLAEASPGFMLGSSFKEWFSEGIAEMVNGGIPHMDGRSASQMCSRIGLGNIDYGGSYLAVCYASWLSACKGYGGTCTISADNLAYGLDRIIAKLLETGNLDIALSATIGMNTTTFESHVRSQANGELQNFLNKLNSASTNSEGILGCGSVIGGNLKLTQEYVIGNFASSLNGNEAFTFRITA